MDVHEAGADEMGPFSYVAPVYVELIQKMIQRRKGEMGIIISDHNYNALLEISVQIL